MSTTHFTSLHFLYLSPPLPLTGFSFPNPRFENMPFTVLSPCRPIQVACSSQKWTYSQRGIYRCLFLVFWFWFSSVLLFQTHKWIRLWMRIKVTCLKNSLHHCFLCGVKWFLKYSVVLTNVCLSMRYSLRTFQSEFFCISVTARSLAIASDWYVSFNNHRLQGNRNPCFRFWSSVIDLEIGWESSLTRLEI